MKRNDFILYIPKELIINPNSTGLDILLYAYIRIYGQTFFKDPICLSCHTFADKIYGNPNHNIKEIKKSLSFLEEIFPEMIKSTFVSGVINIDLSHEYNKPRVAEPLKTVDIIMKSSYNYKLSLIKYYFLILASVRSNITLGTSKFFATDYPTTWFAKEMDISRKTISLYTSCLEKLKLIYVHRDNSGKKNNVMGKYENKELIKCYAQQNHYFDGTRSLSNKKRSLMAKFNYLVKQVAAGNPSPYTQEEVAEIRNYIIEHNKYCKSESKVDSTYLAKIKDISIIDNIKYT